MQASALHAGSGQLSLAALAVFAIAPLSAGVADGGAPAVLALDMRADARAPAVLADCSSGGDASGLVLSTLDTNSRTRTYTHRERDIHTATHTQLHAHASFTATCERGTPRQGKGRCTQGVDAPYCALSAECRASYPPNFGRT